MRYSDREEKANSNNSNIILSNESLTQRAHVEKTVRDSEDKKGRDNRFVSIKDRKKSLFVKGLREQDLQKLLQRSIR